MRKHNIAWFVLFWALSLVLASTLAVAQSEENEAEVSKDSPDFVYTMEYMEERVAETEQQATSVTNKSLDDRFAEPVQATGTAITNDDLQQRFSEKNEDGAETAEEAEDEAADTDQRAELIAELEAKIAELQSQLDELREEKSE